MPHIFICPECRNEHGEPAEAHFVLHALCSDCAFELEFYAHVRREPDLGAAA